MTTPKTTILACTDGSLYAASVYDHAAWCAQRLDARIRVLHMLDARRQSVPHPNFSGSIGLDVRQQLKRELVALDEARARVAQSRAKVILAEAREHLERAGIGELETEARHGALAESIEQQEAHAEMVVIGKRGESADFEKMHLGANLERVIRSCHHPVLVASRSFRRVSRALIAYDGGPSAGKAVEYLAKRPLLRGLHCELLLVGKPGATVEADLERARERLQQAGIGAVGRREEGHAEEVIARRVAEESIDLLVMGAYGHSRIRQLIVGSTTTAMVRTCLVPVLLFR